MNLLIVEDVTLVAERIAELARSYFQERLKRVCISYTLEDARFRLGEDVFDLLLLDLNLNGQDGFRLLEEPAAAAMHTMVITANRAEAVRAFDLGVADFIAKPIQETRFTLAMERFDQARQQRNQRRAYLAVKTRGQVELILIRDILYIQAAKNYVNIHLSSGAVYLHHQNIHGLLDNLPTGFVRIHRSFILSIDHAKQFRNKGAGRFEVELCNGHILPMNRASYQLLTNQESASKSKQ